MNRSEEHQKFLLETAVNLDRKLTGKFFRQPIFFESAFQLLFNLFGFLLGFTFLKIPPAKFSNQVTAWIARYHAKNKLAPFFSVEDSSRLKQIQAELKPAKLILISHPETSGSSSYLLGNLIYYAVKINRIYLDKTKFKFVQAIDPFALDTLHPFLEATYAGFMAAGHIAMDRQPYQRTFLQKLLFLKYHYTQTIFQLLRELKAGRTICLALSGGVMHNARIFYTVREFAQRVFRFAVPEKGGITKKEVEKQIISILSQNINSCVVSGKLLQEERSQLFSFFDQWKASKGLLPELEEELSLSVPYRFRLFHILFHRVVARKIPLLVLPLLHTKEEQIVLKTPIFLSSYEGRKIQWIDLETGEEKVQEEKEFVKAFVKLSFHTK